MRLSFRDIQSARLMGAVLSGHAHFEYDEDFEMVFATAVWLAETATMPPLKLTRRDDGARRALFEDIEDQLLVRFKEELSVLIPDDPPLRRATGSTRRSGAWIM